MGIGKIDTGKHTISEVGHIRPLVEKDVVGLLIGEVVSTKKKHILAKDVVGLLVEDNEDLLIISQN